MAGHRARVHTPTASGWATTHTAALAAQQQPHVDKPGTWHSQQAQDRVMASLFGGKRGGYYLDLAASNGMQHSNTRTLERDYGWDGLCVEANPQFWSSLTSWRECRVVGAAIAERRAEMGYFSPRLAGMGGLVRRDTDNARRNATLRVLAVPLTELFDQFQVPPSCAAPDALTGAAPRPASMAEPCTRRQILPQQR